jgi:hypothetical protein
MVLNIVTPYGDRYKVDEQGRINGHDKWRFLGIASTHGFAFGKMVLPYEDMTPAIVKATQWRYRTSGNPRFTVVDLDHGTRRVWGNTAHHGIRSAWYSED